jgi:hypothetical protein
MRPFSPRFACCGVSRTGTANSAVPNPYSTDFSSLQAALKFVPLFCLEIRASFLLLSSSQKKETLLLFLLSLNLSISPRKNEFVFGLFPPLESLSDS